LAAALVLIASTWTVVAQDYQAVFICPQGFAAALTPLAADAESEGWQVDVITIEYIDSHYSGATRREKIKSAVADLHAHGLQIVSFVGDADYSGQEPQYDIIPLWYYYCPEIGYWRDDRATMIDYVDFDGDRIPDVAWTWIPAHSAAQVANLVSHSLYYKAVNPGAAWLKKCLWLVEDEDLEGNSGAITRALADSLMKDAALSSFGRTALYDSNIPCCYSNREAVALAQIDGGVGAVFGMGTVSKRTSFVEFMSGYFYFDVTSDLAANDDCGVYFGLSCGLGEFDRPADWRGLDFCSQFLFDSQNKGASFWIGPSGNTRYYSNYYLGRALVEQLFQLGARTTAEACFMALRRAMTEHPEFQEAWEGQNFFGSPFHVMHGMRRVDYTAVDESSGPSFGLAQNFPNPFNPSTSIFYSLDAKGHVRLKVFDPSGRLVRALVDEVQGVGPHRAFWDGCNDRGHRVASGVYMCQLQVGPKRLSRKLILAR